MLKRSRVIVLILSLLIVFYSGCGNKIDPKPYITQAEKDLAASNTPEVSKYSADLLKIAEDCLNQARSSKEPDKAVAMAAKAEIYAKVSQIMAESKSASESEISKSKEAEAKAKAEIEIIKASLQRAKRIVPQLKSEIEKVLKELESLFEEKPEGEKVQ